MNCNCPRQQELKTVHTYKAGLSGSVSEMRCPCGKRFVFVKLLQGQIEEHGDGAYAVAQRLKRGELALNPTTPEDQNDAQERT